MKINHLKGLIAAPFTPTFKNGEIDTSKIPTYFELLEANQINGAFICGSTGEGASLTTREKMEIAEAWAAASKNHPEFKVMTLVGGNCIKDAIKLAKHAADIGLYAVAFTSPSYFKPQTVEILSEICFEIASQIPNTPFYYYHIPVLTGVSFSMIDLLQQIHGKIENFAGIKFTHEDFMDYSRCLAFENHQYDILWGRDECWLSALAAGAKGAVGSTFNYAAPLYHQITEAFENGHFEKARLHQLTSIKMISLLSKYGGIAVGKSYMKLLGLDLGHFRLPVKNPSKIEFEHFSKEATDIGFFNFCSGIPKKS
jgi:N-acetylneuraminate lyase